MTNDTGRRTQLQASSFSDNCILGTINAFNYMFAGHTRNLSQATRCSPPGVWMAGHETAVPGSRNDMGMRLGFESCGPAHFCTKGQVNALIGVCSCILLAAFQSGCRCFSHDHIFIHVIIARCYETSTVKFNTVVGKEETSKLMNQLHYRVAEAV